MSQEQEGAGTRARDEGEILGPNSGKSEDEPEIPDTDLGPDDGDLLG